MNYMILQLSRIGIAGWRNNGSRSSNPYHNKDFSFHWCWDEIIANGERLDAPTRKIPCRLFSWARSWCILPFLLSSIRNLLKKSVLGKFIIWSIPLRRRFVQELDDFKTKQAKEKSVGRFGMGKQWRFFFHRYLFSHSCSNNNNTTNNTINSSGSDSIQSIMNRHTLNHLASVTDNHENFAVSDYVISSIRTEDDIECRIMHRHSRVRMKIYSSQILIVLSIETKEKLMQEINKEINLNDTKEYI